jgi:hypothetical protein
MLWTFVFLAGFGFIMMKLGAYSVWFKVLSGGLLFAGIALVFIAAAHIWRWITTKPNSR